MKALHTRRTRLITAVLAALALGTSLGSAQAAVFKDAQLESLHEAGKFAELEQQAQTRLKANPADAEASAALVLGLSLADPVDAKRMEAGAQQAKLCTDRHPAVAVCHLAAAQNLSLQMLNMGMAKAMRSVGSLKDVWIRTLELEPTSFTARVQLAKLYVMLAGADDHPIDHRLGDTLLAKGDKAQAKAVYERFIANKRAKPANVEEVRKSLARLG